MLFDITKLFEKSFFGKKVGKKIFGKLFDTLETVDSYIEVETIIDQMKN